MVILLIVMIGVSLGELLSDIAGGRVPSGLLWALMFLKIPEVLGTIVPLAVFVAVIWGLGRLYRDQEMAVMRASGFNWRMLLRPLFSLLLPVAAALLAVGLFLGPMASSEAQSRLENAFRNAAEWGLQAGQFHVLRGGELVLYVESVEKDGRTLRNIFIQMLDDDREQIWSAEQGYYWLDSETGNRYLTLENGQITEGGEDSLDYSILRFSRNDLKLPESRENRQSENLEAMPSSRLLAAREPSQIAEIQWRLSPALAAIVLGLLAIPLSHSAPREGRGGRALLGLLAYTVYANLLYMCRSWIAAGTLPAIPGMWWVHALVLAGAILWLYRQGRMVGSA